ncbi:MAG: hypothetical protein AAGI30_00210 [Planctomycetota bacterium]
MASRESFDLAGVAGELFVRFQDAVTRACPTGPDRQMLGATELARELGLDTKLAWKLVRLAEASDPLAAAPFVPGKGGVQIFAAALEAYGVGKRRIDAVRSVFAEYLDLVSIHAGSRQAFDSMVAGFTQEYRERIDLDHRRMAFIGNSYLLGVQARVLLTTHIIMPDDRRPDGRQVASIRGVYDLRRLREKVPFRFNRLYALANASEPPKATPRLAIDPAVRGNGDEPRLPLLTRYCSQPLPEWSVIPSESVGYEFRLVDGAVGNAGVVTCVTGEVLEYDLAFQENSDKTYFLFTVRTPAEFAVFDLLVHDDLVPDGEPDFGIRSEVNSSLLGTPPQESDALPFFGEVMPISATHDGCELDLVPEYAAMIDEVFSRLSWSQDDVHGHRVLMRHPPVPSSMVCHYDGAPSASSE